jgi:hypothetical protein
MLANALKKPWLEGEYLPSRKLQDARVLGQELQKSHCPYYHSQDEKRKPLPKFFKLFPKCRTVNFPGNFYYKDLLQQRKFEPKENCTKQTSYSVTACQNHPFGDTGGTGSSNKSS